MDIEKKMRLTIDYAKEALQAGELPIAAIIFDGDEIVAKSYTSEKADKCYLIHAELKALLELDQQKPAYKARRNMQLFSTLEPCMMCMGAAMSFCIGEIYYALESPSDGAVKLAQDRWGEENKDFPTYKLPKILGGLLREESRQLFLDYVSHNEKAPQFAKVLADLK